MSSRAEISLCTHQDYNQILDELHEFWGARETRHLHHPFLVHEFGNSAFVIRNGAHRVFVWLSLADRAGRIRAYGRCANVRPPARPRG